MLLPAQQKALTLAFLWLMLVAHAAPLVSPSAPPPLQQTTSIFLLAGQSNMSGRGGVINGTWDGVVPPQCQPNPSIIRLTAGLSWVEAQEPLHQDIDYLTVCGVGPGMSFAHSVLDQDPSLGEVALVPCAIGGTNISQWSRGAQLYNQLVMRANVAVQGGGTIRGMLWYQGESDTMIKEDAELYKGRLEKFFQDIRTDLSSLMLPIIQVALASGQGPYIETVRQAQLGIDLPNARCVDAKGLGLEPDELHLNTAAQVRLGGMLADAFLQTQLSRSMALAPLQNSNAPQRKLYNFVPKISH